MIADQEPVAVKARPAGPQSPPPVSAEAREGVQPHRARTAGIALLTGGGDRPYALGITSALTAAGLSVDFIGSDDLSCAELLDNPKVNFLNLRGNQSSKANPVRKALRVLAYYVRLLAYAATSRRRVFHLLWNNKFEFFDRTALMLYYRLLGKRVVLTAHNVNAGQRDGNDSWLNRFTLGIQYRLAHHVFVHTQGMKRELCSDFHIPPARVSVIPFGINNTVPTSPLTSVEARQRLGLGRSARVLLFFGGITPYKGLEYAIRALAQLAGQDQDYHLLVAGRPKGDGTYWQSIQEEIVRRGLAGRVTVRSEYIPDGETELYFKAADVLLLPYTHIFQSGVLFLGYGFGLPVIAADVGALSEEIVEGQTGFVFKARDADDLAAAIQRYFVSGLYRELDHNRPKIRAHANEQYSWTKVAGITTAVYSEVAGDQVY